MRDALYSAVKLMILRGRPFLENYSKNIDMVMWRGVAMARLHGRYRPHAVCDPHGDGTPCRKHAIYMVEHRRDTRRT